MTPPDARSLDDAAEDREERPRRRRFGHSLGRYRMGPLLGAGGAASVYLARLEGPHGFGRLVALKVIHEHLALDREFLAMLLDEAGLSARLSHPGIAHTYELGEADGIPFIAMEYLSGQPLSRVYRRAFEVGRPLPHELVAWIGACAARALHHAHELKDADGLPLEIVHRDVSPENLFATQDGQIKLLDFGIATAQRRRSSTSLGDIKGKFRYMSPEYVLGEAVDRRLDVFALGATLYELSLGVPPFDGGDAVRVAEQALSGDFPAPRSLRSDFPDDLARVLSRALSPEPAARYATLEEMALALDGVAERLTRDAAAALGEIVRELFAEELSREAASVAELCALPPMRAPEDTSHVFVAKEAPRSAVSGKVGFFALALAAAAGVVLFVHGRAVERAGLDTVPAASELKVAAPEPGSPSVSLPVETGTSSGASPALSAPSTGVPVSPASAAPDSSRGSRPRAPRPSAAKSSGPSASSGIITEYPFSP